MRKRFMMFLAAAAALLTAVSSCTVDKPENGDNIVEEGYTVYVSMHRNVLSPVVKMLDMTLKADRWLKCESDEEREAVGFRLMYADIDTLFHNPGNMHLESGDRYELHYTSESIMVPGTEWRCRMEGCSGLVRCVGENEWEVELNPDGSIIGTGRRIKSMSFSATTADLDLMDFDWENEGEEESGSGRIFLTYVFETDGSYTEEIDILGEPTFTEVTFRTDEPSTVCCRQLSLPPVYDGAFSLHLYADGPVSRDEDISVTLSGSASSPRIFVEYMGLKNYWIGG